MTHWVRHPEDHEDERTEIRRMMMTTARSPWFIRPSSEKWTLLREISTILKFAGITVTNRQDLAILSTIVGNFHELQTEMRDLAVIMWLFGLNRAENDLKCPRHNDWRSDSARPPSAQRVWGVNYFWSLFNPSTLGTAWCSSGKSVRLTKLREIG